MATKQITTTCLIAGGGPAGMMCGFLLARAGVDAIVLEKHKDFLRDFRGDTVHPSTMQVLHELGLLEEFLKRPHQEITHVYAQFGDQRLKVGDMSHLPTKAKFIALMPQWDFLDFLASKAKDFPHHRLMMKTEAKALIVENGVVTGVRAEAPDGPLEIRADLVIGADGRHSGLRDGSGLPVKDLGVPIDVLWTRIAKQGGGGQAVMGRFAAGAIFVMLDRGDYWQSALVIKKGGFDAIKAQGLEAFRKRLVELSGLDSANDIESWDDVKLLTVTVDRMEKWWRPGLLFIGDAAHAMSPIGGIGINLAIQDAVAASNLLAEPLRTKRVADADLEALQKRRFFPTWATQGVQVAIQNNIMTQLLDAKEQPQPPFILKLAQHWTFLQRIPARVVGMGVRPEHVRTKAA
ncbi:MAG TPA: FAD-dependent oxidoreductase [Rhizomicrobium sp.]|jgi:2-polyprenyl-6-methoxyphenol hydroxylase-like FAD-dependent oxidoreductase